MSDNRPRPQRPRRRSKGHYGSCRTCRAPISYNNLFCPNDCRVDVADAPNTWHNR